MRHVLWAFIRVLLTDTTFSSHQLLSPQTSTIPSLDLCPVTMFPRLPPPQVAHTARPIDGAVFTHRRDWRVRQGSGTELHGQVVDEAIFRYLQNIQAKSIDPRQSFTRSKGGYLLVVACVPDPPCWHYLERSNCNLCAEIQPHILSCTCQHLGSYWAK